MSKCQLIQGDCLEEMDKLIDEDVKVDMVLTDPPYGLISHMNIEGYINKDNSWDNIIPSDRLFNCCKHLLKLNRMMVLFSCEPYTSHLRNFKNDSLKFAYPLYWLKDHFANGLGWKKSPVSYVEDISVFRKEFECFDSPFREYSEYLFEHIPDTRKEIMSKRGNQKLDHFFRFKSNQFNLCSREEYEYIVDKYNLDELDFFISYDSLLEKWGGELVFNTIRPYSNVLKYNKPYNRYHPTEKPVPLLEDLILTYTNPNDTILDFTMGSGSTGVACLQTNRNFIGIELEPKYYEIAKERCSNYQSKLW